MRFPPPERQNQIEEKILFLLMSVFSEAFFSLVCSDFVTFSFFTARHNFKFVKCLYFFYYFPHRYDNNNISGKIYYNLSSSSAIAFCIAGSCSFSLTSFNSFPASTFLPVSIKLMAKKNLAFMFS